MHGSCTVAHPLIGRRFSDGTLKPLEALELKEGEEVTITIVAVKLGEAADSRQAFGLVRYRWSSRLQHFRRVLKSGVKMMRLTEPAASRAGFWCWVRA